jgi:hypothetical protein
MIEIQKYDPCHEALVYRRKYKTFEDAWNNCPRGDWMLWIAKRLDVDIKILTKAKALCALTVKHLMKDKRSIEACEIALKFSEGKATVEELSDAAAAADDATYAAADADGADAAYAAAAAAYAAADAAYADAAAAYAAAYAAADSAADADGAARKANILKTADICRKVLTKYVLKEIES